MWGSVRLPVIGSLVLGLLEKGLHHAALASVDCKCFLPCVQFALSPAATRTWASGGSGYLVRGTVVAEDVHLTIGARGSLVALRGARADEQTPRGRTVCATIAAYRDTAERRKATAAVLQQALVVQHH